MQTRLDLIHKQDCQHRIPVWPLSSGHAICRSSAPRLMRTSGSEALLWVEHYKCPGLPHQWCRIREQRQANPLSCCAPCICVCVCASQVDGERETGLGYRQLLLQFALSPERPAVFLPIASTSLLQELTYIIQRFKPWSAGTDRAFNKHFNLPYWSTLCYLICLFVLHLWDSATAVFFISLFLSSDIYISISIFLYASWLPSIFTFPE